MSLATLEEVQQAAKDCWKSGDLTAKTAASGMLPLLK